MKNDKDNRNVSRRTFLKATAAGVAAAATPTILTRKADAAIPPVSAPGPDEQRVIDSAKKLNKKVDLTYMGWGAFFKGAKQNVGADFKKKTGIGVGAVTDVGFALVPQRAMAEAVARSGKFDIIHVHLDMIPTLASAGMLEPLDDYMKSVDYDYSSVGTFVEQSTYRGHIYGLVTDGNCHTYVVRKDLQDKYRKEYEDKHGTKLGLAKTWKEYIRQGKFFANKEPGLSGFGDLRARKWGYWWYLPFYYSKGLFPFKDDGSPNFDNDLAEEALAEYVSFRGYMPKDADNWGTSQMLGFGLKGNIYQATYWGGGVAVWELKKSKMAGKLIHGILPGSEVDGRLISRSIAAGPPGLVVNRLGRNKPAAAHMAMYMASRQNSTYITAFNPFSDPWRKEHFQDPNVRRSYTPKGTDVLLLNMQTNSPTVRVTGAPEFHDLLDRHVNEAWMGRTKVRAALKKVDEDWKKAIKRIGQKRITEDIVFYKATMPKVDYPKMS